MIELFELGAAGDPAYASAFSDFYHKVLVEPSSWPQRDRIIAAGYLCAPLLLDAWTGFLEQSSYLGDEVPKITTPTWLAWARDDQILAWELCRPIAEQFPLRTLDMFAGGHAPFLEAADAFAAGLQNFLDRT